MLHASNFAISKSCRRQSKALDKSVMRNNHATPPLSSVFFNVSIMEIKQCCALNPFLKPHRFSESFDSI